MNAATTALILSTIAGLGTALGGLLVVCTYSATSAVRSEHTVGLLQAFSAGVMLFMSFCDILPETRQHISELSAGCYLFLGMFCMAALDYFVPDTLIESMVSSFIRETSTPVSPTQQISNAARLKHARHRTLIRSGVLTFVGMALHNAPEGLAVYLSTIKDARFGASLAFAIACHNVPEGMAVAIPIYIATQNPTLAIQWTFINGLLEPVTVLIASYIFGWDPSTSAVSFVWVSRMLAMVAGVMVFLSLDELYPSALEYVRHKKQAVYALIAGMAVGLLVTVIAQHE